jgi:hypothetical protein
MAPPQPVRGDGEGITSAGSMDGAAVLREQRVDVRVGSGCPMPRQCGVELGGGGTRSLPTALAYGLCCGINFGRRSSVS